MKPINQKHKYKKVIDKIDSCLEICEETKEKDRRNKKTCHLFPHLKHVNVKKNECKIIHNACYSNTSVTCQIKCIGTKIVYYFFLLLLLFLLILFIFRFFFYILSRKWSKSNDVHDFLRYPEINLMVRRNHINLFVYSYNFFFVILFRHTLIETFEFHSSDYAERNIKMKLTIKWLSYRNDMNLGIV